MFEDSAYIINVLTRDSNKTSETHIILRSEATKTHIMAAIFHANIARCLLLADGYSTRGFREHHFSSMQSRGVDSTQRMDILQRSKELALALVVDSDKPEIPSTVVATDNSPSSQAVPSLIPGGMPWKDVIINDFLSNPQWVIEESLLELNIARLSSARHNPSADNA